MVAPSARLVPTGTEIADRRNYRQVPTGRHDDDREICETLPRMRARSIDSTDRPTRRMPGTDPAACVARRELV
ncbi:hypothetical protein GCM10012279_39110 [Micromonospora yangpuensis]|nr:hypothetical protein GCM10012279_39110 [Micromonospora yangpuensis]